MLFARFSLCQKVEKGGNVFVCLERCFKMIIVVHLVGESRCPRSLLLVFVGTATSVSGRWWRRHSCASNRYVVTRKWKEGESVAGEWSWSLDGIPCHDGFWEPKLFNSKIQQTTYGLSSGVALPFSLSFATNSADLTVIEEHQQLPLWEKNSNSYFVHGGVMVMPEARARASTHWILSLVEWRTIFPHSSASTAVPIVDRSTSFIWLKYRSWGSMFDGN